MATTAKKFAPTAGPKDVVVGVYAASIHRARHRGDEDMESEYNEHSRWLRSTVRTLKRKILESAGMAVEGDGESGQQHSKRAKTDGVKAGDNRDGEGGKENDSPNVVAVDPSLGGTKKLPLADPADDKIVDVYGMKVAELRSELRKRGLEVSGLKKELQKRLEDAMNEPREERDKDSERLSAMEEQEEEEEEEGDEAAYVGKEIEKGTTRDENNDEKDFHDIIDGPEEGLKVPVGGAVDFPGVDAAALESAGQEAGKEAVENQHEQDAMEVEVETKVCASSDEGPSIKVQEMEQGEECNTKSRLAHEAIISDHKEPVSSGQQSMRVESISTHTTSQGEQDDCQSDMDMSSSSKSVKKKALGKKIMEVTAKLFSPPKKKEKSPIKIGKSPAKLVMPGVSSGMYEEVDEDRDIVKMPPPPPTQLFSKEKSNQLQSCKDPAKKLHVKRGPEPASSNAPSSLLKAPATRAKGESTSSTGSTASTCTMSSTSSAFSKSTDTKKIKELAEARKARLAEMRGKSKPVPMTESQKAKLAGVNPAALRKATAGKGTSKTKLAALQEAKKKKATASSQVVKKPATTQEKHKEEKRKQLAAQMREKAAAAKALKKETTPAQSQQQPASMASKKVKSASQQVQPKPLAQKHERPIANQPMEVSQQQAVAPQAPKAPQSPKMVPQQKTQEPKALSPMDTYEISDRETDSEDDYSDSEDEDDAPKKRIPKWALKSNLIPALERQFIDGPDRVDPDEIFPEVSTCDLSAIFNQKKARYQKRTSSGNWTKDKVTAAEKLIYKRTMGFEK